MLKIGILASSLLLVSNLAQAQGAVQKSEKAFAAFEELFGVTKGKRRNHTKGFCIEGHFAPADPAILKYSMSPIFRGRSDFVGRVSHKGGKNKTPDNKYGLYGLAFELTTAGGDAHIINMNTEHFFPVATPEAFTELLIAKATSKEAVKAFAANNPELRAYKAYHGKLDKSLRPYEGATYNSINSFYLVNEKGERTAVRWSFVPSGNQELQLEPKEDFLLENMKANLASGGVSWDMVITLANEDDAIDNPSVLWTGDHARITVARLTVKAAMTESDGQCDEINYDPLVLTDGVEPSEDPLLEARSLIYAIGVGKRLSEKE